ncbi:MAG TPA: hypothetical protein VLG50_05855 [Candidatus Saccharimonadales bacterium]|nr:hypothetical protein [Candidatus Saccharimonadales bacterium]
MIDARFSLPHAITPYYRIINNDPDPFWYYNNDIKTNVTPYQFFVLTTRLRHVVDLKLDILFYTYRYEDKMKYTLELDDGDQILTMSKLDAKKYQYLIDDIIKIHPNHCTLFYFEQPIVFNKIINKQWLFTILPYLLRLIDEAYQPLLYNNQILVNLINIDDYLSLHMDLQKQMINHMYDLYQQGVVVANAIDDHQVINDYRLVPLYQDINNKKTQLYIAHWTDDTIKNKTEFLLTKLRHQ